MNNTALVRIKKEYEFLKNDPPENFVAFPIKDDLFTWHFTIRGADDTEFENGLYHGVIKLPTSYPLRPPSIMFLTPNGRFDINLDVCLSVTKYHKEEWQAAWTIRTILEAIIAFFPIKEDHEAIGAIDYPIEVRKKMAVQSRKWKCDICGCLVDLLPEKKPKIEIKAEVKVEPIIEDNKSESSGNQISETEGNRTRSKTKIKKVELDRKSHLSNIEGVIFEDINEYAENEEEGDINIKRSLTDLKEKIVNNNEQVININSNKDNHLKKAISDEAINQEGNFNDYLKQLRQSQFAQQSLSKSPKKEETINTTSEINFKPRKETQEENVIKNPLHNIVKEESQFYEIISTIKCLKSKDPNELLEELKEEEQKDHNFGKIKENLNLFDEFIKNLECKVQNKNIKESIKTNPDDIINFIDGKDKIEKLLKQKNNALKYLTQKSYKETRTNTLRGVNIFMICTIILVFVCYHFGRNYF